MREISTRDKQTVKKGLKRGGLADAHGMIDLTILLGAKSSGRCLRSLYLTGWILSGRTGVLTELVVKRMKPVSRAAMYAQFLDLITTFIGLALFASITEANPVYAFLGGWRAIVLLKLAATGLIVFVLERVDVWPVGVWIVPLITSLPVFWNMLVMMAELIA